MRQPIGAAARASGRRTIAVANLVCMASGFLGSSKVARVHMTCSKPIGSTCLVPARAKA
jgi:hypothetical protein